MAASSEEKMNNLLLEVRVLEDTYSELTNRQSLLERALIENRSALDTIKGLESGNAEEVLMPIGGGVLLRSPPPSSDKVLVNIGLNVVVEKSRESATSLIEKRADEYEKSLVTIMTQRTQIAERLESDRVALNSMMSAQSPKR